MKRSPALLAVLIAGLGIGVPVFAAALPPTSSSALIWLSPSSLVASGGAVTAWNDLNTATGAQSFIQTTASAQPAVAKALLPSGGTYNVADFNGTSSFLELGANAAMEGNQWTWFLVMQGDNLGANLPVPFRSGYSNSDRLWGTWYDTNRWAIHARDSGGGMKSTSIPDTQGGWVLLTGTWDGSVGTVSGTLSWQDAADPTAVSTLASSVVAGANAVAGTHLRTRLGANTPTTANSYFQGKMAELVVFDSVLSGNDFAAVSDYLAAKYLTYRPITDGLVLYSPMDNNSVHRGGIHPTAAAPLSTLDTPMPQWTVEDVYGAVRYHGTAQPNVGGTVSPLPSVVSSAPGRIGQAIQFAGITGGDSAERRVDYGDVANHGTGGYTVAFWFNPEVTSGTQFLASKGNGGSANDGWSVWLSDTGVIMRGKHDGTSANRVQLSKGGIAVGNWHHVALVLDDAVGDGKQGVLVAYLNGEGSFDYDTETLVSGWSQAWDGYRFPDGASFATSTSLRLGARASTGAEFQGLIDDFAIWNRALSAAEIATIYQMGLQGLTPIPEPGSATLLLLGVLAMAVLPRRNRSRS